MILELIGNTYKYECEKIIRIFFPSEKVIPGKASEDPGRYIICGVKTGEDENIYSCRAFIDGREAEFSFFYPVTEEDSDSLRERLLAKAMIRVLSEITGIVPPWGILTGIRPAKLMRKYISERGAEKAVELFTDFFEANEEKTFLAENVALFENRVIEEADVRSFSLYVSIPFCPTRCSYCSFVSHSVDSAKKLIPDYVKCLCGEIKETARLAKENSLKLETVYIGGGTPTSLGEEHLKEITDALKAYFDMKNIKEFTVEAGRPDTITPGKLLVLKNAGVTRISINPQTFSDSVLTAIGRRHTAEDTLEKFRLARDMGFDNINMDFIAGLPSDSFESFCKSIDKAVELSPENITVHTLSVKRSSDMNQTGKEYCTAEETQKMVDYANKILTANGYLPYYMYRQSKSVANLENVGWCKKDYPCLYNIYMMEEIHTVLAVGASAVTKLTLPGSEELQRIFNYKYPYEYISDFGEMIKRKNAVTDFYKSV
ncbi:MAG: coproporphyrinogen dehydrogenase HemZ [Clostridia bacterium]|nr:coproporphyrinogen dehydrogenase HemZ [Clostridia bacterium]